MKNNSAEMKTIIDSIELYRVQHNKPKDEKIKPLDDWDIQNLPKLPEKWGWLTSNEISTFITNGVHSPTAPMDELGINKKMLRITDIDDSGTANYSNLPYCKRFVKGDYEKTIKKNDIYISFTGNVLGKRYIVNESNDDIVYAHYFVRWQPIIVNPQYIYYVLLSKYFINFMHAYKLGSTQPNLKVTDLKRVPLPIAPIPIQNKIAHILSTLDEKIELNRKMNQTLEEMALSLFKSWFVDFDPVHAKMGCANDEELEVAACELGISKEVLELFPSKFEESELGIIPEGWEVGNLGSVLIQRNERAKASQYTEQLPYVPIDCIDSKSLFLTNTKSGKEAKSSLISFYQYDIIFGAMRPYFHKVCIAPFNGTTRSTAFVLKASHEFDYSFAVLSIYQDQTIKYATSHSSGTTMPYVKWKGVLESMPIVMPHDSIRSEFNKIMKPVLESIQGKFIQQNALQKARDTLLPKLLSGELDVSNIDMEVI